MEACIDCDACFRACPKPLGAIVNHAAEVIIIPELCSGCTKCVAVCPVDCIHPDPHWRPSSEDRWAELEANDPYAR